MTFPSKYLRYGAKGKRGGDHRNSKKTHCPAGHEYNEENTYIDKSRNNARRCRKCQLIRNQLKPVAYRRGPYKRRCSTVERQDLGLGSEVHGNDQTFERS